MLYLYLLANTYSMDNPEEKKTFTPSVEYVKMQFGDMPLQDYIALKKISKKLGENMSSLVRSKIREIIKENKHLIY